MTDIMTMRGILVAFVMLGITGPGGHGTFA